MSNRTSNGIIFAVVLGALAYMPSVSAASIGDASNSGRHCLYGCDATWLAMRLEFGGQLAHNRGIDLALNVGPRPFEAAEGALVPLLQTRFADGHFQTLELQGVDVLNLQHHLNASGEATSWTPWAIGGLVGAGALAIVVRYATTKERPQSDLSGAPGSR